MQESLGVNLAWSLACLEAASAAQESIEPEHFLAALAKLAGVLDDLDAEERLSLSDRKRLRTELTLVHEAFRRPPGPRHPTPRPPRQIWNGPRETQGWRPPCTAPRTRTLFEQAKSMAQTGRFTESNLGHLLLAILLEHDQPRRPPARG